MLMNWIWKDFFSSSRKDQISEPFTSTLFFPLDCIVKSAKGKVGGERTLLKGKTWISMNNYYANFFENRGNQSECLNRALPGWHWKKTAQKTAKGISILEAGLRRFPFCGRFQSIHFCGSVSEPFFTLFFNFLFLHGNGRNGNSNRKYPMILNMLW